MSNRSHRRKNLAVVGMGVLSTVLTGIILAQFQIKINVVLYSFMIFKIVPLGALYCGCMAASGYVFGVKILHPRVNRTLAIQMILSAIAAYFVAQYITYLDAEQDGIFARDVISFWEYLDWNITDAVLTSSRTNSIPIALGYFSYLFAGIQIAGFAGGSLVLFRMLKDAIFCDRCSVNLNRSNIQEHYTDEPLASLLAKISIFKSKLEAAHPIEAVTYHAKEMGTTKEARATLRTRVTVHKCSQCGIGHLQFNAEKSQHHRWKTLTSYNLIHWYEKERSYIEK